MKHRGHVTFEIKIKIIKAVFFQAHVDILFRKGYT